MGAGSRVRQGRSAGRVTVAASICLTGGSLPWRRGSSSSFSVIVSRKSLSGVCRRWSRLSRGGAGVARRKGANQVINTVVWPSVGAGQLGAARCYITLKRVARLSSRDCIPAR